MILVKNWNFFLCLLLNKIGLAIMFPDLPLKKQSLPRPKNKDFTKSPYGDFFQRG